MKWIAAVSLAGALCAAQPDGRALFEQAALALQRGDLTAAEAGFSAFLKQQPAHVGALGNLGVVYSRQGLPAKAAAVWERALRSAPADVGLRTNLGLAYLRLEDYTKARTVLEPVNTPQARELYANSLLYLGEPERAEQILSTLTASPGALYSLAVARLKLGKREAASEAMERLLDQSLDKDQANFLRGKAYYESGLFDEALAAFDAVKLPQPGLALERGKLFVSLRRAEAAEQALRAAVAEASRDAEANYFLGALLVQQDRAPEGLPFLETALAAKPGFWGTHYYLGRAHLQARRYAASIRELEAARAARSTEPQIAYQLSRAYQAAGRPADARAALARFRAAQAARQKSEQEALVIR
jgi:tetratricopeptide (TPR) repeat protein